MERRTNYTHACAHGNRIVSRHRTERAARNRARRWLVEDRVRVRVVPVRWDARRDGYFGEGAR